MGLQTNGKPLTDRALQRGLRINILAGCLGTMWGTIAGGMPLTMFMKCIGASGVTIGLTATVGQVAMALQIPAALVADRLPARKPFFAVMNLTHRLLWFVVAFLPLWMAPGPGSRLATLVVCTVAFSGMLAQLASATWWSWMADLVPTQQRASFWGRRHSLVSIASLLAILAAGFLLDAFPDPTHPGGSFMGFILVFGLAALLGSADIIIHMWVPEPKPLGRGASSGLWTRLMVPFANRDFLWLTLAMGVWTFSVGLVGQFGFVYLNRAFNVSYSAMSMLTISAVIGGSLAGILWSYVMDRVGARNFGAIMMLVAPLLGAAWFFLQDKTVPIAIPFFPNLQMHQPMLVLLIVNVFGGLFYSGVALSQISLLSALAPVEGRTLAMSIHWAGVGLLGATGPLVGGWVMDGVEAYSMTHRLWVMPTGTQFGFFHLLILIQIALVWLVAVRLLLAVKQREGEMAFRTALANLQFSNPLRMLSGIFNISTMMISTSRDGRAGAVRRVGEDKMRIAVRDLIEQLDDPSAEVREAAAQALGRIGSPDAEQALVGKLEDPTADIAPQIARALRHAHSRAAVEALIRRLNDTDRETVSETARTLGEIGDERARGPLLEVLQRSRDAKIVSASSEALAQLGEMAALYEIFPRMQAATNPVLKRSLAMAAADLLGVPGEFYSILIREQRQRGSEAGHLLDLLRDAIAESTRNQMPAQGRTLSEKSLILCEHYTAGRMKEAVDLLFDLALGLAALRYGIEFGNDAETFVETMIWHDVRFGVGVWYLELLREESDSAGVAWRDGTEVLLGIYVLSRWSPQREPPPQEQN
jgi:MFS family permease